MDRGLRPTLFLLLLLCSKATILSQFNCPHRCQCFTPAQVLCADEHMTSVPGNISVEAKEVIIMTSAVQYLFPTSFDESPQLNKLIFFNNPLQSIHSQAFQKLPELQELEISGNPWLQHLFLGTFSKQGNLTKLQLNYNRFQTVLPDTFLHVGQLMELHLDGNRIAELADDTFSELTKLKVLNLRGNRLTTFNDRVLFGGEVLNLTLLDLRGNRLTEVSSFSTLLSLTDLLLSSNQLSSLPKDIFTNVTSLENVDLSENRLTSLPERIFAELKSIKMIHLHKNQLISLDSKLFQDQEFIQQLYLSDNQLQNLPLGLLDHFTLPHMLRLHGNPWKCDCHMWYLHDLVLSSNQDFEMLDRMLCETPDLLRRRPVASIGRDELLCRLPKDEMTDLSSCTLRKSSESLVIKCKVDKCSPLTVKVEFLEHSGSVQGHIWKSDHSQCSNVTIDKTHMP
ncbi:carboxypeptidase N subunit 2 isoform X2 [Syngnathus typhle]|uniref:carboxypeptidase N subunit 2 isoform X2 n=1 Tax=Syngnathus typhle TaxID=161592 RepID=UPI002A6AFC43|nr:carboxypeptidase N subunit 2 isoform X2 [Syngnathus typhle]